MFHSIEVPLLLGYRTSFKSLALRIGGGPMLSFLMKTNGELNLEPGPVTIGIPQAELDAFNQISLGAGVGVDIGPFLFDIMYELSFSKVGEEISRTTPVVAGKESIFLLGVGYKLIKSNDR